MDPLDPADPADRRDEDAFEDWQPPGFLWLVMMVGWECARLALYAIFAVFALCVVLTLIGPALGWAGEWLLPSFTFFYDHA